MVSQCCHGNPYNVSTSGELFSEGEDDQFSDVMELPATTTDDESEDEVPVRERSNDNIITVSV